MADKTNQLTIDFTNTKIAYGHKNDKDLAQMEQLFRLMSHSKLTHFLSSMGLLALRLRIPFVKQIIKNTMFKQFCGGETLSDCQAVIDNLKNNGSLTILDYGAEAKSDEKDLDAVEKETIKAIKFASSNQAVPVVSSKFTGLVNNDILEKLHAGILLNEEENERYQKFKKRGEALAKTAFENGVSLYVDAEETWIQNPIDELVEELMEKYNREKPIVFNTYQMYVKHKLNQLKEDHKKSLKKGYLLGAKLVRGAYMEKERARAIEKGYPSPICDTKEDTDYSYDEGIRFVVTNYKTCGSCNASHNEDSNMLQAVLIDEMRIRKDHPHLNFSQLYGMSDHITFNLGNAGYNAAKYLPYGSVSDVFHYLVRRAQENKSMSGDMGKELKNIVKERKRR